MTKAHQFADCSVLTGIALLLAALFALAGTTGFGQALPAAEASPISTGFALPRAAGSLQWGVSVSEGITYGYYGQQGSTSGTSLSGDVAYLSNAKRDPFSAVVSAGRSFSTSGQPSYLFLNLGVSQVIGVKRWTFVLADSLNYLPGTATPGLSGVAGQGDLGVSPVQVGPDTGQGVLTNYSARLGNSATGSAQRAITGRTSFNISGAYSFTSFLGSGSSGVGLDNASFSGGGGMNHEIDARTSVGGSYAYSTNEFSGNNYGVVTPGFTSQTASAMFSHQITRKLGMTAAAGPEWTTVNSGVGVNAVSLYANVGASYGGKATHAGLSYVRSTNNGYGVIGGALSDSVAFSASRTFALVWNCSITSAFTRTTDLPGSGAPSYSLDTFVEGAQTSRALMRNLSAYASYTALKQSNQSIGTTVNAFSGLSQVFGFGLTYSPSAIRFGRQ